MEDKTYSITLADGTVIDDLKLNGNNFISKSPITKERYLKIVVVRLSSAMVKQK